MNKGLVAGSLVLLAASVACIAVGVIQVIRDAWAIWSAHFLGAAAVHAVTAVIAAALLMKAVPPRGGAQEEAQP